MEPPLVLVEYALGEGLLAAVKGGWVIETNGRLVLRRMLAGADPFSAQHQERRFEQREIQGTRQSVVINDRSSPLGWLSRRLGQGGKPMVSKNQFAAGERLAQDFLYAGMAPRITSNWSFTGDAGARRSAPGLGIEMSDNRMAAQQRVRAALNEVGRDLSDILLDICCFQIGLAEAEKKHDWPRRSGKLILQIALDRLVQHYGMEEKGQRPDRQPVSKITHWGDEGYKPV